MFKHLKEKRVILVTGPQRSGTHFIAKAIAYDTGHRYIDEAEIHTDSIYEVFWLIQQYEESLVIQCPGLCHLAPALVKARDEFFLVMCMRDIKEIVASQKRIHWDWEWLELLKYSHQPFLLYLNQHEPIAKIKYEAWKHDKQSLSPKKYLEVQYDDMKNHPLWIPKEQRKDWGFSQTEILEEQSCS